MLNDDTRVIADGGEYLIPESGFRRNIKGYGIDFHLQPLAEANDLKIPNRIYFQKAKVMIVSNNVSQKYSRIQFFNILEREDIPTMIYDKSLKRF